MAMGGRVGLLAVGPSCIGVATRKASKKYIECSEE